MPSIITERKQTNTKSTIQPPKLEKAPRVFSQSAGHVDFVLTMCLSLSTGCIWLGGHAGDICNSFVFKGAALHICNLSTCEAEAELHGNTPRGHSLSESRESVSTSRLLPIG